MPHLVEPYWMLDGHRVKKIYTVISLINFR